ncbi:MAG: type III pantothenate kinase [Muribaculaceae bacterium]|nr:type III pantothenate kinase [Muribaculaceae bacterium]
MRNADIASVDVGNTSIKVTFPVPGVDSSAADSLGAMEAASLEEAAAFLAGRGISRVAFSTTRELSASDRALIKEAGWWELRPDSNLPLKIVYDSPSTLGTDRLAAALGAAHLFPGEVVLVADVGTALTLDVVACGAFLGGMISPGVRMRLEALHHFTSRLPLAELPDSGEVHFPATDTFSSLQAGALWGVAFEVASAFAFASRRCNATRLVVTGGGAHSIFSELEEALPEGVSPVMVPQLVHIGLNVAFSYNHE